MKREITIISVAIIILISACANTLKPLDKLAFKDSKLFDRELSLAMKAEEEKIEVMPLDKFSMNKIPERMDRWFVAIDNNEGKVESVDVSSKKRGVLLAGTALTLTYALIKKIREKRLYKPADNYEAILYHDSGIVERVVFVRKVEADR